MRYLLFVLFAIHSAHCLAMESYTPSSDAEVVDSVRRPFGLGGVQLERLLRSKLREAVSPREAALDLAKYYYKQFQFTADQRHLGRAQAALGRYWTLEEVDSEVLVLRGLIKQGSHRFGDAIADLERATRVSPNNVQAWLSLSSVHLVTGKPERAAAACQAIAKLATLYVSLTCLSAAESMSGGAQKALANLSNLNDSPPRISSEVQIWSLLTLADTAERMGQFSKAESAYRQALSLAPHNTFAMVAYADFLLNAGRSEDVLALQMPDTSVDALLLRHAIAAKRSGSRKGDAALATLKQRYSSAQSQDSALHQREDALYLLDVEGNLIAAAKLAFENWTVQKESVDALLLVRAAAAANRPDLIAEWEQWARKNRYQDVRVQKVLDALRSTKSAKK